MTVKKFVTFESVAPRIRLSLLDWLLALIFLLAGVGVFTRHADFPSFYHPDEPSKARQVIEHEYNFNHPMLLLQTTRLLAGFSSKAPSQQSITETGRLASAIFSAAAIACLVLLAAHLRSSVAALLTGLLLLANHQLYELAHYMKEDPSLAFGIAFFFLCFTRCWLAPTRVQFALLGVGCAMAVSGKYLGVVVLPLAVWAIWAAPKNARVGLGLLALAAFVATFALVNYPMLIAAKEFFTNVGREMDFAVNGHKGITRSVPHGVYGAVLRESTNPGTWILLGIYYLGLAMRRRQVHPAEWAVALFPVVYVLLLSFSPKTHHRYFLPDTLLFCTLAILGLCSVRLPLQVGTMLLHALLFLGAWIPSVVRTAQYDTAFQNDTRAALVEYVRAHVPADAVIVQDKRVNLPNRKDPRHADSPYFLEQPLLGKLFAADLGTIGDLRAQGISYVAVSDGDFGRFFLKTHTPREEEKAEYDRRRAFYEQLFAEGELRWESPAGLQQYLQPSIKLYYLPPTP